MGARRMKLLRCLTLLSLVKRGASESAEDPQTCNSPELCGSIAQCTLYMAESTIPGAGLGIFTAIERHKGETIGSGDVLLPLIDHNFHLHARKDFELNMFFDPFADYVWHGYELGMRHETTHPEDHIVAFAPGLDATINCNLALLNVDKAAPSYDTCGLHRSNDPGAGAFTPYYNMTTKVIHDIPPGGELFKYYGDIWFETRPSMFGLIPLKEDYPKAENLTVYFYQNFSMKESIPDEAKKDLWSIVTDFPFENRTLNALPRNYSQVKLVAEEGIRALHQPQATRSLQELHEIGRCLDYIKPGKSTLPQAGRGAFATTFLPKGSIVAGNPLLIVMDAQLFRMYEGDWWEKKEFPDSNLLTHYQIGINYCWHHRDSSIYLCPYGVATGYINHNQTLANVGLQWVADGEMGHKAELLKKSPEALAEIATPGLFIDVVATRDIELGEEIFLDYGDDWEEAWKHHAENWNVDSNDLSDYQSARDWNKENTNAMLRTQDEQEEEPYPAHFEMRCLTEYHDIDLDTDTWEFATQITSEEAASKWESIKYSGTRCSITHRKLTDDGKYRYRVLYEDPYNLPTDPNIDWFESGWIVREAITFKDAPYTTDLLLIGSFRHPIGIPEDIFPDAWRGFNYNPTEETQ